MRLIVVSLAAGLIALPAAAQDLDALPLGQEQLSAARGQLVTAQGLTFGFSAKVRTYVDGQLSLESGLALTDKGVVPNQPARTSTDGPAPTIQSGAEGVATAQAGGISLPGFDPDQVKVLPGQGGATALIQSMTSDQISSVVLNTANDRDIRQQVDLTFVLPDFAETQALSNLQTLRSNIQSALDQALTR
jgi:hypothetical protein